MAKFGLEIHPEKTRLIEFGRFAQANREARGEGSRKPSRSSGFTHYCGVNSKGYFVVQRKSAAKRIRAKLQQLKQELRRKMHEPPALVGEWLTRVVTGHYQYFAVPGNRPALSLFRHRLCPSLEALADPPEPAQQNQLALPGPAL